MKKMILVLAIMAIASGAFAAWDAGATESFNWFAASGTDTSGTIEGTDDATIYARFRVLGPAFTVVVTGLGDTWEVIDFMPGDYGWQTTPFDITNTGGMALDIGTLADDADGSVDAITHTDDAYLLNWPGSPNKYKLWAAIVQEGGAVPTMADDATTDNNVNFADVASGWYDASSYMVPNADAYWHTEAGKLNLWATDRGTGSDDDACDLYLGAQIPFAGWSHTGTKTIPITVYGRITTF